MRAHLVQMDIAWEDKGTNWRAARALLASAKPLKGDLVILPEMFDTGFSCNLSVTADRDEGTLKFLRSLAQEFGCVVHGQRTAIGGDGLGRNRASVVNERGEVIVEYDKVHLFPLGLSKEAEHFGPGAGATTYLWTHQVSGSVARVCPTICYDLRFPELYREGLALGAEVFVVSSSWPSSREGHRRALSIARAIENQAFVLSVNRCGRDPALEYAGGSIAIGPRGDVLGELGAAPGVLSVEIDIKDLRSWRAVFPAWRKAAGPHSTSNSAGQAHA